MDTDTTELVVDDEAVEEAILDQENTDHVLMAAALDNAISSPDLNLTEQVNK